MHVLNVLGGKILIELNGDLNRVIALLSVPE